MFASVASFSIVTLGHQGYSFLEMKLTPPSFVQSTPDSIHES
jgi:hypothetical protein